ncbi:MAG: tryptophan synthase subunit alpha [Cyanobacteria bacterium J06592_8]
MKTKTQTISECFQTLRERGECALIPFITAGDPDLDTTAKALQMLDRSGADMIELGVPYSDPLADGPVIQAAATRALAKEVTLEQVLSIVRSVTPVLKAPLVLFSYYNPILYRGIRSFLGQVADAGAKGLVVPDLPLEEAQPLLDAATEFGIEVILLVAPTSDAQRIQAIASKSQGFIYLVSVTGVTGVRSEIQSRVQTLISDLKESTDKPIGVGFGISGPEQAKQIAEWGSDAVIVGSAFVRRLAENSPEQGLKEIEQLARDLKKAIA